MARALFTVTILTSAMITSCASVNPLASMTPTKEIVKSYQIYDIKGADKLSPTQLSEAIKVALQKDVTGITVTNDLPPHPLPEQAGRFQLSNPFEGSAIGALAATSGQSLEIASCKGSIMQASASNDSMASHGESANFTVCLWPYKDGYHLDFYSAFTKSSGGFSAEALGDSLARSIVGDSSQSIPKTIDDVLTSVKGTGVTVSLVEKYPG
ncbi:MAG: hypothetical protein KAY06_08680 [Aeromonadaceae bacterium]|nr:hypothetical protein [Aeromonadaceae bacterium]